jgi:hypothetical protein
MIDVVYQTQNPPSAVSELCDHVVSRFPSSLYVLFSLRQPVLSQRKVQLQNKVQQLEVDTVMA